VGKIDKPINGITKGLDQDCDDQAHIIAKAEDQIQFIHASENCQFMVGQVLEKNQGVTFKVLEKDENEKEGCDPKHLLIKEVVREENMHYYQVPKLGSYLAIKLEYDSCLFEEAFDAALEDYSSVQQKIRDQE